MATLKTTISLESSSLFPTPLKLVKTSNLTLTSDQATSQRHEIEPASSEILFESSSIVGKSGVLYFYAHSESTNGNYGLDIIIENKSGGTSTFAKMLPSDVAYLPIYAKDNAGIKITVRNCDPAAVGVLSYMYWFKD